MTWIKEHKLETFIVISLAFLLPLLIVHMLFKWNTNISILQAEWSAGELLGYIAGFETLLGTALLSFMALMQNYEIKQDSEFLEKANTKRPFFIIDKVTYKEAESEQEVSFYQNQYRHTTRTPSTLYVYLKNVGDGVANESHYEPYGWGTIPSSEKPRECIAPNALYKIPIRLVADCCDKSTKTITLYYSNLIGFRYKQVLIINATTQTIVTDMNEVEIDGHLEYIPEYGAEEYITDIELISPQIPIGFMNAMK